MRNRILFFPTLVILLLSLTTTINGQKYTAKNNLNFQVAGTSTLHDWEMTASNGTCAIEFSNNAAGEISGVSTVSFNMPAKSLKSGKGPMDKNAYTALKTDKFPNISAKLKTANLISEGASYNVKATISLTMAGVTKDMPINVKVKRKAGNTIEVSGEKKLTMTDFSMVPPVFMMGAVKTGDDVTVKFSFTLTESNQGTTAN